MISYINGLGGYTREDFYHECNEWKKLSCVSDLNVELTRTTSIIYNLNLFYKFVIEEILFAKLCKI